MEKVSRFLKTVEISKGRFIREKVEYFSNFLDTFDQVSTLASFLTGKVEPIEIKSYVFRIESGKDAGKYKNLYKHNLASPDMKFAENEEVNIVVSRYIGGLLRGDSKIEKRN